MDGRSSNNTLHNLQITLCTNDDADDGATEELSVAQYGKRAPEPISVSGINVNIFFLWNFFSAQEDTM